ncbi:MAG: hypothetical protein ACE5GN_04840, partial [Waddliaceae bacterium]
MSVNKILSILVKATTPQAFINEIDANAPKDKKMEAIVGEWLATNKRSFDGASIENLMCLKAKIGKFLPESEVKALHNRIDAIVVQCIGSPQTKKSVNSFFGQASGAEIADIQSLWNKLGNAA